MSLIYQILRALLHEIVDGYSYLNSPEIKISVGYHNILYDSC